MKATEFSPSRRGFIAGSTAAIVSGCVSCPDVLLEEPQPGVLTIGDAHCHFFNASDLPVEGFLRDVALRERAPELGGTGRALISVFVKVVKPFSITVEAETVGLYGPLRADLPEEDVPAERYAVELKALIESEAAKAVETGLQIQKLADRAQMVMSSEEQDNFETQKSFRRLAALLRKLEAPDDLTSKVDKLQSRLVERERRQIQIDLTQVDQDLLVSIARGEPIDEDRRDQSQKSFELEMQQLLGEPETDEPDPQRRRDGVNPKSVAQVISWGFIMMQSRCNHVRKYLKTMRSETAQPRRVVNLLVDYDYWLNDRPSRGSSADDQIRFWHRYSQTYEDQVSVKTFAGYDPLRHAYEMVHGTSGYFDGLIEHAKGGRIAGFKLYPPMGFQAIGNENLEFQGSDGIGNRVIDWWRNNTPDGPELGDQLDQALKTLFRACVDKDLPILAHAGPGNATAKDFGKRANPLYWKQLLSTNEFRNLRINLGHFTDSATRFITGVNDRQQGKEPPEEVWELHSTNELVKKPNVFVDIGYTAELFGKKAREENLPQKFFSALKWYCERYDSDCSQIMFGSDWIMLGLEAEHDRYVEVVQEGMRATNWSEQWQSNFLRDNLERFLNPSNGAKLIT